MNIRSFFQVVDFFIPLDVAMAVLVIFSLENIIDSYIGGLGTIAWVVLYLFGITMLCVSNYLSADEEEIEDLGGIDSIR